MSTESTDEVSIITIEGGIGVGKSTVMDALRKVRPSLYFIDEPVKKWEETGLLEAMYKKEIPAGTFQIAALATRMAPLLKAIRDGHRVIVTERCPWSDFKVFTETNLAAGSTELTAYRMAYDALMTAMPGSVNLCNIYLTASVDTLLKRMAWRARDAEKTESDDAKTSRRVYLENLQERHDVFFACTAKELGVVKYVTKQINSERSALAVAQQVEFAVQQLAPVKLEPFERKRARSAAEDPTGDKTIGPTA